MRENILKNQKGVTLLALVIVIMVLMILATVSISTLISDHGAVEEATNAAIQAEVARVAEVTDVYLRDKETQRLKKRDYSSPTIEEDLANIITPVETQEKISLGIYRNFVDLGFSSDYGKGGVSVDKNWSGNMADLEDCFAIDLKTKEVYYIDKGDIWKRSGKQQ